MQRSKSHVKLHRSTRAEEGTHVSCCEDVHGSCSDNGSDDESTSSDEDEVMYMDGMRVFGSPHTPLGDILENADNDEDNSLDQIRNRHGEELAVFHMEIIDELVICGAIQGRPSPRKTYIEYLREKGRFINE